jgi:ABC-type multidrug transport system fused ATPase/permease subunit
MSEYKKLISILSPVERTRAVYLFFTIIIVTFLDMLGVASIMPFIAILTNPNIIETNAILKFLFLKASYLGVENQQQFLIISGIIVFLLLIVSISFKAFGTYFQTRYIEMVKHNISERLVEKYLYQTYSWFLGQNSSNLGKSILSEVGIVIGRGLNALINLVTNSLLTLLLFSLLVVIEPVLTLIVIVVISLFFVLVYKFNQNLIKKIDKEVFISNANRYKVLLEAFGAIKEIKLAGLENVFLNKFSIYSRAIAKNSSLINIISQLPRYALELISFGGMILIIIYYMLGRNNISSVIPLIALYAFAGYRLMPAIQHIFMNYTGLKAIKSSINSLYNDLNNYKRTEKHPVKNSLKLNKEIQLKNISYNYPNSSKTVLKNINLNIQAFQTIGIVGETGSGKSTMVDIILGLIKPQEGLLTVDGREINNKNKKAWQNSIGYVPQKIYLADDTIYANIAFGKKNKEIIEEDVERASKIAYLHEFIEKELPLKYQTIIGENGAILSGGQRQRIGIARAVYNKPKLLVFDEATSSLDNLTEKKVMEAIYDKNNKITKILITHRLSTVKKCDKIFLFDKGHIIKEGTFEELIKVSKKFKSIAEN